MEDELILLDYWASPYGARVRIALAEKGITNYTHKFEENLANKSPLLIEMNPVHKKIPVLIHGGKPICESNIIVQYVDEVWMSNSPLMPSDHYHKAKARFLVHFIDTKIYDSSKKIWMGTREDQEIGKMELIEWCKMLEKELRDKPYFGGDDFGFVDIAFVPFYNWIIVFKTFANFSIEQDCPKLVNWGKRCMERDTVSNSLPNAHQVYQAYLEFKEKLAKKLR